MLSEWIWLSVVLAWGWTNLVEPFYPRLRRRVVRLPELPPSLDGFTILHLSDLHTRRMGALERKVCRLLAQTSADIAVLTGDLVDADSGIAPLLEILSHVHTAQGVYAVFGNSEHKPSRLSHPDRLAGSLRENGVHLLINETRIITHHGATIWLAGVDDPHSEHADVQKVAPLPRQADLHLLLAHSPDVLLHPSSVAFDLILCGHTHCGQIRIPGLGALWSHTRLGRWAGEPVIFPQQVAHRLRRSLPQPHVIVSPGLATVGTPLLKMRLFCPPEVTLLQLAR
ncbi:MAG: metallophosphoesterase family protein [Chthonomonadetes bacterium]|nr:metallophosphoesterase family protein [Chthonomonadetes bacterium]